MAQAVEGKKIVGSKSSADNSIDVFRFKVHLFHRRPGGSGTQFGSCNRLFRRSNMPLTYSSPGYDPFIGCVKELLEFPVIHHILRNK
jgi:hypothetical protein